MLATFIREHIGLRNLYFGVNPRTAGLASTTAAAAGRDVAARRVTFLDLDNKDAPNADPDWQRTVGELRALGPVLMQASGNGWHAFLPMEALEGAAAVSASATPLAAAMARLGADNTADAPRIARLPFTINLPTASKLARGAVPRLCLPDAPTTATGTPSALDALCATLRGVAERLGLPGRGAAGNVPASHLGAAGERKTGQPAPSLEALRLLLEHLPNGGPGEPDPYANRDDWQRVGHAVKGAAQAAGIEAEARGLWLDWCARWPGSDGDKAAEFWSSCREPHTGWGTLMRELERVNPAGHATVKAALAAAEFAEESAANRAALAGFMLAPAAAQTPRLPPVPWLYGRHVIRGFYTVLAAAGGTGKSALLMTEAVAMSTGRTLLPGDAPLRALTVWFHTAEDRRDDLERALEAALRHHKLTRADLGSRLFLTSGRDVRLMLARQGREGAEPVPGMVDSIVALARQGGVDVIVLDPIAAMHGVAENDNAAVNVVVEALRQIAERADVGVVVAHHTSKLAAANMGAAGAGASRGASALTDGARAVRQLDRMKEPEAVRLGLSSAEARDLRRVDNGKSNLAPLEAATWRRVVPVELRNGTPDYPRGDTVPALEAWEPPVPPVGTNSQLAAVQGAVDAAWARGEPPARDGRSHRWVGYLAAPIVGLDVGPAGGQPSEEQRAARERVGRIVEGWVASGGLTVAVATDPADRKRRNLVRVGTPAVLVGTGHDAGEDGALTDGRDDGEAA